MPSLVETPVTPAHPAYGVRSVEPRRSNNLTLVDGKSFLATTVFGDITPAGASDVGLFNHDTRYLSRYELEVNSARTLVLSAGTQHNILSQIELTTANLHVGGHIDLSENSVHLRREQLLAGSRFYERLQFDNFNLHTIELDLELNFDADFADVFQVRGTPRLQIGTQLEPVASDDWLGFGYVGRDGLMRCTWVSFLPTPSTLKPGRAGYRLQLAPHEKAHLYLCIQLGRSVLGNGNRISVPSPPPLKDIHICYERSLARRRGQYADWSAVATSFESSDRRFDRCLQTALSDFFSLSIPFHQDGREGSVIAAGIPWFATVFGRDSLIAGYQALVLQPELATFTLRFLARHQGKSLDDWRDQEPGKILHEMRDGEMTRAGESPHSPYCGSVDSTPLFLIVLDETFRWTGDEDLLRDLMPAARRALEWIDRYADLDGDSLIEYQRRSPCGLVNQNWKDSWDSNLDRHGNPLKAPIAACEVQGYCYDARMRLSRLLSTYGEPEMASHLKAQAEKAARHFEEGFWLPKESYYAMALDAAKIPLPTIASNAGHLLWSRMISEDRARLVVQRLLREDMFTGWGVRTMSAREPLFNPLSYHRGSVWPHDNSIIAQGMAFYGFKTAALAILTALFEASAYFRDQRLPELFAGVQRQGEDQPVSYPVSCSPQAWASGAWFLLLTAALGLLPNASRQQLRIENPTLPEWLQWLRLHHLRIGQSDVSLEFSRRGDRTFCNVLDVKGGRLAVSIDVAHH